MPFCTGGSAKEERACVASAETQCKVTPVILHGVVSPECKFTPVILHGVVSPESLGTLGKKKAEQVNRVMA